MSRGARNTAGRQVSPNPRSQGRGTAKRRKRRKNADGQEKRTKSPNEGNRSHPKKAVEKRKNEKGRNLGPARRKVKVKDERNIRSSHR